MFHLRTPFPSSDWCQRVFFCWQIEKNDPRSLSRFGGANVNRAKNEERETKLGETRWAQKMEIIRLSAHSQNERVECFVT